MVTDPNLDDSLIIIIKIKILVYLQLAQYLDKVVRNGMESKNTNYGNLLGNVELLLSLLVVVVMEVVVVAMVMMVMVVKVLSTIIKHSLSNEKKQNCHKTIQNKIFHTFDLK